jgi:hypothetical protein
MDDLSYVFFDLQSGARFLGASVVTNDICAVAIAFNVLR